MSRRIHVAVDIAWCLRKSDKALGRMLVDCATGLNLPADEVRAKLIGLLRQGYDVIPPCDDFDDKGYCRGHES